MGNISFGMTTVSLLAGGTVITDESGTALTGLRLLNWAAHHAIVPPWVIYALFVVAALFLIWGLVTAITAKGSAEKELEKREEHYRAMAEEEARHMAELRAEAEARLAEEKQTAIEKEAAEKLYDAEPLEFGSDKASADEAVIAD